MITYQEFQVRAGVETQTLRAWVEASWLIPRQEDPAPSFSEADVARAQLIRDLTEDLGVNEDGVGVILSLVDQIHGLRRTLGDLVQAIRLQPEPVQRQIAAALRGATRARSDG
jgi:chaperone modulatory protein CbpM